MVKRKDILATEYNPYYTLYMDSFPAQATINDALVHGLNTSVNFIENINLNLDYRYEPRKWSIGQVLQHCIDTERVFTYRALRFMRGDTTALEGFNQDVFANDFNDYAFAKAELLQSLVTTRKATIQLFNEVQDSFLARTGIANGNLMSVRAIPFILAGHQVHHEGVIKERYL